jgi:endonuclease-3
MKAKDYERIFATLAAHNPHPKTELHYRSHFELLIAVMLSAQATDISVNKATGPLFAVANTASSLYALGEAGLIPYIKSIGLYKSKAKHVIETCGILCATTGGAVPEDRAALEALPGVGRKTANVVLNTAFGWPVMAVDTHIFRVGNRTGMTKGSTTLAVENQLTQHIPSTYLLHAHHWLILHGRYICKARQPLCHACPIYAYCQWPEKPKRVLPEQET